MELDTGQTSIKFYILQVEEEVRDPEPDERADAHVVTCVQYIASHSLANNLSLPVNQPFPLHHLLITLTLINPVGCVKGLCSPHPGFHTQRCLAWIKLHLPFVYRIQLSPSLGP